MSAARRGSLIAPASPADIDAVAARLGRRPAGRFEVAVRDAAGQPVVIRNAPFLDDGTPMPTMFWLVDPGLTKAVGRLESQGGVRAVEALVAPEALVDAHRRYQVLRDAMVPPDRDGPVPAGGVGGTRTGVKCLHAHLAWWLAGGDDPVGDEVAARLGLERPPAPPPSSTTEPPPMSLGPPAPRLQQGDRPVV